MNLKRSLACVGLAAGAAFSVAAPSLAGTLTPSRLGLDTLNAPPKNQVVSGSAHLKDFPYFAREFSFKKDTVVRFSVLNPTGLGSRGRAQSNFGFLTNPVNGVGAFTSIFSEDKAYDQVGNASYERQGGRVDDWLGTCGNAIGGTCVRSVLFKANTIYQLALNPSQKAVHFGVGALDTFTFNRLSDEQYPKSTQTVTVSKPGTLFIGMEDGLYANSRTSDRNDYYYDYQDWVVSADVPEPATLAGLGMVAGGMLLARRRKAAASA
ncbi:MAG: PEP-CTERM sorting domain-containing protein [Leptolyngbya sp. IPPAS B-1204]|nr:PEP-CTERM sorting domain-containing protein [Elainella sp. C42_A2020_010]